MPLRIFMIHESESHSVVSNSATPDYTVHGILQARILEWVAVPFSRVPSQARDRNQVSGIAGRFLTSWATTEAHSWFMGRDQNSNRNRNLVETSSNPHEWFSGVQDISEEVIANIEETAKELELQVNPQT